MSTTKFGVMSTKYGSTSTKYVVDRWGTTIKAHECTKETAKCAWIKDVYSVGGLTQLKKDRRVFDTWAEAHAELTRRAEAEILRARLSLQKAQSWAGNVRGMKPPQEVQ